MFFFILAGLYIHSILFVLFLFLTVSFHFLSHSPLSPPSPSARPPPFPPRGNDLRSHNDWIISAVIILNICSATMLRAFGCHAARRGAVRPALPRVLTAAAAATRCAETTVSTSPFYAPLRPTGRNEDGIVTDATGGTGAPSLIAGALGAGPWLYVCGRLRERCSDGQ